MTDPQYDVKTVKTVRGTESRSIAKWEKQGWEFIDQSTGTLQSTLNFRRPKKKVPWVPIAAALGVLAVIGIVGGVASSTGSSSKSAALASASVSLTPTPAATSAAVQTHTAAASPASSSPQTITTSSNADLAALLKVDGCDASISTFATKYAGRNIEFDGSVANVAGQSDPADIYHNILIGAGDKGVDYTLGPNFQFVGVSDKELHLTGASTLKVGDKIHVVATVGKYGGDVNCLFELKPVSTALR